MNGRNVKIVRRNYNKIEAVCHNGCRWRLYASLVKEEKTFAIRKLQPQHTCSRVTRNRAATAGWIAKEFISKFRRNPNWDVKEVAGDLMEQYAVEAGKSKCYRSRNAATQMLKGFIVEHYALLRPYKAELMRVDSTGRFDFLINEVDELGGALLAAVAKDGNDQMYHVFWAVVQSENEHFWTWFMNIVFEELNLGDGLGWTFISDQQKGLCNAIVRLAPLAQHRNCAGHVYCNWKKEFKGQALKKPFWAAARQTHEPGLNLVFMLRHSKMRRTNEEALRKWGAKVTKWVFESFRAFSFLGISEIKREIRSTE
ncbi:uncharacterized protein LOC126662022 [Mercurialis annua]|uniref:uncharacterized protein LOC126662022 n=1 Tax=Mercurialis annua TaxID=3986 RepID=UPI00215F7A3B|nr:uncharacterized protein LOC126662022 [Mercurialis annua]